MHEAHTGCRTVPVSAVVHVAAVFVAGVGLALGFSGCSGSSDPTPAPSPSPQATLVQPATTVDPLDPAAFFEVQFDLEMDAATITDGTVTLSGDELGAAAGSVTYDAAQRIARFTPERDLHLNETYELLLATTIASAEGATLDPPYSFSFQVRDGAWTDAGLIDASDTEPQSDVDVAAAADGTVFVVWERDVSDAEIMAARILPDGTVEPPVLVGGAVDPRPRVAADANGNAIATWQDDAGPTSSIHASRYDAQTGVWSDPERIDGDSATPGDRDPRIAMDPDGSAIVNWEAERFLPVSGVQTYALEWNEYSPTTGAWNANPSDHPQAESQEGFNGEHRVRTSGTGFRVQVIPRKDAMTRRRRPRVVVSTEPEGVQSVQDVDQVAGGGTPPSSEDAGSFVLAASGGYTLVAWEMNSSCPGCNNEIQSRVWSNFLAFENLESSFVGGSPWEGATLVNPPDADVLANGFPAIALDRDGRARAVWDVELTGEHRAGVSETAPGTGMWLPRQERDLVQQCSPPVARDSRLALDELGDGHTVWVQLLQCGVTSLWSRRLIAGEWSQDGERRDDATLMTNVAQASIAVDGSGRATLVWVQDDAGDVPRVRFARFE